MKFQRFTPSGCKVIWIRKFQFVAKILFFYDIILFFFLSAPVQVWFQFIISFYSFHPSQFKIGSSLSYPFILFIRPSPRLVQVYHILLFFSSVPVQDLFQFIISIYSINPLQFQIGPSLSYPFILLIRYSSRLVPVYHILLLSIRYSSRLVPVYHILLFYQSVIVLDWSQFIISSYSINQLQFQIGPNLLCNFSLFIRPS